ncbi:hypothetical protein [Streptomyces sp. NPDC002994]
MKTNVQRWAIVQGDEENSQGETGSGSDGQEGNPPTGCGDDYTFTTTA